MKPIEETWYVDDDEILLDDVNLPANHIKPLFQLVHHQETGEAAARLRLASKAPEMARMLLKLAEAAERRTPYEADSYFGEDAAEKIRALLGAAGGDDRLVTL